MSGVNNNYLNPLKLYRMPQNALQQVAQTGVSAQLNVPVPTAVGQISKGPYTLAELKETGLTDELIKKYFEVNEDGKYVLKQGSGYSCVEELLYTYHQTFANSYNSITTSTSVSVASNALRSDNNTEEKTDEQYIEKLKGISEKDGQKAAVDKFIQDFVKGNVTWEHVPQILEAIGIEGVKTDATKREGSYCVEFTFEGKKHTLYCNKEAAASGSDDVRNKVYTKEQLEKIKKELKDFALKELGIDDENIKKFKEILEKLINGDSNLVYGDYKALFNKVMLNLQNSSVFQSLFTSEQKEVFNKWNENTEKDVDKFISANIDVFKKFGEIIQALLKGDIFKGVVYEGTIVNGAYALNTQASNYDFFAKLLEEMYPEEPEPSVPDTNGGNNGGGSVGGDTGTGKTDDKGKPDSVSGSGNDKTLSIEERAKKRVDEITKYLENNLSQIQNMLKAIGINIDATENDIALMIMDLCDEYSDYSMKPEFQAYIANLKDEEVLIDLALAYKNLNNPDTVSSDLAIGGPKAGNGIQNVNNDNLKECADNRRKEIKEYLNKNNFKQIMAMLNEIGVNITTDDQMGTIALNLRTKYTSLSDAEVVKISDKVILYDFALAYTGMTTPVDDNVGDGDDLAAKLEAKFNEIQTYLDNPDLKNKLAKEGMEDNRFESIKVYLENYYQGLKNDESLLDINDVEAFILKAFRETNKKVNDALYNITYYLYTNTGDFNKALQEKGIENDTAAVKSVRDALQEYYSNLSVEELLKLLEVNPEDLNKGILDEFMARYNAGFDSFDALGKYLDEAAKDIKKQIKKDTGIELSETDYSKIADEVKAGHNENYGETTKAKLIEEMIAKAKELKGDGKSDNTPPKGDFADYDPMFHSSYEALDCYIHSDTTLINQMKDKFNNLTGDDFKAIADKISSNHKDDADTVTKKQLTCEFIIYAQRTEIEASLGKKIKDEDFDAIAKDVAARHKDGVKSKGYLREEFKAEYEKLYPETGSTGGTTGTGETGETPDPVKGDFKDYGELYFYMTHGAVNDLKTKGYELEKDVDYQRFANEVAKKHKDDAEVVKVIQLLDEIVIYSARMAIEDALGKIDDETFDKIAQEIAARHKTDEKVATKADLIEEFKLEYKKSHPETGSTGGTAETGETGGTPDPVKGDFADKPTMYTWINTTAISILEELGYDYGTDKDYHDLANKVADNHKDDYKTVTHAQLIAEVILYLERTSIEAALGKIDDEKFADVAKAVALIHRGDDVNKIDKDQVIEEFQTEYEKLYPKTGSSGDTDPVKGDFKTKDSFDGYFRTPNLTDAVKKALKEKGLEYNDGIFKTCRDELRSKYETKWAEVTTAQLEKEIVEMYMAEIKTDSGSTGNADLEGLPELPKGDFADYNALTQWLEHDDAQQGVEIALALGHALAPAEYKAIAERIASMHQYDADVVTRQQLIDELVAEYDNMRGGYQGPTYPSGYMHWGECMNAIKGGDIRDAVKAAIGNDDTMAKYYEQAFNELEPLLGRYFTVLSKEDIIDKLVAKVKELSSSK